MSSYDGFGLRHLRILGTEKIYAILSFTPFHYLHLPELVSLPFQQLKYKPVNKTIVKTS